MAGDGSLWPVIVGGAIALGGVAVTSGINFLMKRAESQEAKKKVRAEKFEELVEAVYEYDHWMETKRSVTAFGGKGEIGMSPLAKVEAISAVHFPTFNDAISKMASAAMYMDIRVIEAGQKRLKGDLDHLNDGLAEAYKPYMEARSTLLEELKKFASAEFQ